MWYIINNYKTPKRPFIESLQFGDNIGNTVFLEAAEKIFNAIPVNLYDLNDSEDMQIKVKSGKGLILCMANCLTQYWKAEHLLNIIKKLNLNILIFSVGIQEDLGNTCSFILSDNVKELLSLTKYRIYVRGQTSSNYLNSIGISNEIVGCPSIYNAKLITNTTDYSNVIFQCTFSHEKELKLLDFGIKNNLHYIIQSEINLAMMCTNTNIQTPEISSDLNYFNKLSESEQEIFKSLLLFPTTLIEWKSMLQSKDFLITTRVHGALLALELEVLPLLIIIDERTKELAEYHNIPSICIDDCDFTDILSLWQIAQTHVLNFNSKLVDQKEKLILTVNKLNDSI